MQCETNVWGLRPGRAARSARHARRVGGWAAAREDAGCGRRALGGRWLVAGASCCERCGRRASPVWRRRRCKWAANAATASVPCVATAPMQVGRQCGVVVNVGGTLNAAPPQRSGTLNAAPPSNTGATLKCGRHPQMRAAPSNAGGTPITPLSLIMNPRSHPRRCCID